LIHPATPEVAIGRRTGPFWGGRLGEDIAVQPASLTAQ
jgi:hypothetical protein